MEPIDYTAALRRSWRLILVFALLGAVIAVLVPISQAKKVKSAFPYEATAWWARRRTGGGSPLRAGVSSTQILFYATQIHSLEVYTVPTPASTVPAECRSHVPVGVDCLRGCRDGRGIHQEEHPDVGGADRIRADADRCDGHG